MKKLILIAGLSCSTLMSGCLFYHRPLERPEVAIPSAASSSDVQKSIHKALQKYGWTLDREDPGVTTAHLQQNKLFASVRVVYDQKRATIDYVETKNFWHDKPATGPEMIHSRYNVWVKNIAESIDNQLNPKPR